MLDVIAVVFRKEVLDAGRDIKALLPAFLMPVLFAAMTFGTAVFLVTLQDRPQSLELPVVGAERAVPLMDSLREGGITIVPAPEDPMAAVREQQLDFVLVVPPGFNEQFRAQKSASVDLIWDVSRMQSHADVHYVRQRIQQWSATTGALRLLLRGVSPEVSQVLQVTDVNVASDQQMVSRMLGGLPMIILLLAFIAGAGISSEMAAGERENKTLEPVLTTPISHGQLFIGKWCAAIAITLVLSLIGVALQLLAVNFAPVDQLGLRSQLGLPQFLLIMLILLPVIFLATAAQLLVSFLSRSFKDAQSYNQLLMLVPVVPGVYVILANVDATLGAIAVPLLGPQLLIVDIFSGESISAVAVILASVTSLILAALCAAGAVALMRRET